MSMTISSAPPASAVDTDTTVRPASAQAKAPSTSSARVDTAQISGAAQAAAKAARQEATETPAQTAKEAQAGDVQARRLLANQVAHAQR